MTTPYAPSTLRRINALLEQAATDDGCGGFDSTLTARYVREAHGLLSEMLRAHAEPGEGAPTQTGESEDFERGIRAVMTIRCMAHRAVPQMNANEASGAECAVCAVEAARADVGTEPRPVRPPVTLLNGQFTVLASAQVPHGEVWIGGEDCLQKFRIDDEGALEEYDRVFRAEEPPR